MYQFSLENEERITEVINQLSVFRNSNSIWNIPISKLKSFCEADQDFAASQTSSIGLSQTPFVPIDVDTPDRLTQFSQDSVAHRSDNIKNRKRCLSSEEDINESQPLQKKIKQDKENDLLNQTGDEKSEPGDIPVDILERTLQLKEQLYGGHDLQTENFTVFLCSPQQVDPVFELLELPQLPEKCLLVTCKHLISLATSISYTNSLAFMKFAILPKILCLEQSSSRLLLGSLTELSVHFPSQIVEAVLVPCITSQLESHQSDLIGKVIKASLDENLRTQLIRLCTKNVYVLNEAAVTVYQTLLESKCNLDETILHQLVELLSNNSVNHVKNLKYGKVIMAVITKYGKQINSKDFGLLQHAVDTHKSFLQKSLKTALKKIY